MDKDPLEHEEQFHAQSNDKRQGRKERKLLSQKDRSKYKKSDADKRQKEPAPTSPSLLKGRVLAILADGIVVSVDGVLYTCHLRGSLKKEELRIKNLIAIGDFVKLEPQEHQLATIVYIEERYSFLSREEQLSRQKEQLIAVNIDQVLITASVVSPPLKPNLIDRYIIAAMKGNMHPIIVVNKIDLLGESVEQSTLFQEVVATYRKLDIPLYPVSSFTGEGIAALRKSMEGKSSVFSGQSGTGKSSLINAIVGSSLKTGGLASKTGKGSHTTTRAQLIPIEGGGFCVDTPGIKSFGVWDLKKEEMGRYFAEIQEKGSKCKFQSCTHLHEPNCAVQAAVESGQISRLRFDSYCALIASLKEKTKR